MSDYNRKEFINNLIEKVMKKEDLAREADAKAKLNTSNTGYNFNSQNSTVI